MWFGALEAELNGLPGLNRSIPVHMCGAVRVAAAHHAIPDVGYPRRIGVVPAHAPAVNCGCAGVSDFY